MRDDPKQAERDRDALFVAFVIVVLILVLWAGR